MMDYLAFAGTVLSSLFLIIGPIDNGAIFGFLTKDHTAAERKRIALKASFIAGIVLIIFPIAGRYIMELLDISFFAIKIGGGILLLLLAIQIVLGEAEDHEALETKHKNRDVSVFPLAIPLVAGPGAMMMSIDLFSRSNDIVMQGIVLGGVVVLMLISYFCFIGGGHIVRLFGPNGADALARALGILLAAIAVDMIVEGVIISGLIA